MIESEIKIGLRDPHCYPPSGLKLTAKVDTRAPLGSRAWQQFDGAGTMQGIQTLLIAATAVIGTAGGDSMPSRTLVPSDAITKPGNARLGYMGERRSGALGSIGG